VVLLGEIAALSAALFWSLNSIVLTAATNILGAVRVNILRMFVASVFLLITILIFGVSLNLAGYQYYLLILSGIAGLVLGDTYLFMAYKEIGPRLGMLLMSLAPPISALLAFIFFKEILSLIQIAGMAITLAGISFVIFDRDKSKNIKISFKGISYGVLAALGQAVGLIFAKEAFNSGHLNEFSASFIRLFSATIILYLLNRFRGKVHSPFNALRDKKVLNLIVWAAILGPYLGITLSMVAIVYTYIGIASTLMSTVPVMMLPIAKYHFREDLSWKAIAGTIISVVGIAVLFMPY